MLIATAVAAFMTGQAVAGTWRPAWQVVLYVLLLGAVDRFLVHALFEGELLSLSGYGVDTAILLAVGGVGFRLRRVERMVKQYPWLHERAGLLDWRDRRDGGEA